MDYTLRTMNLGKVYKDHVAVEGINMNIKAGEIYGFLGQNGAGKTTTLRMIMGLIKPTTGTIELFGEKLTKYNSALFERVGSVIEFPGFYGNLSAAENLNLQRRLMGMPGKDCIEEVLEKVGMLDARNRQVKNFSLGMKQRLGIARALINNPEFLVLDEPTNGLDPIGIKEMRQLILDLSQKNHITVLISSHILSEIQHLATKIGIIHKGKLIEEIESDILQKKNRNYIEVKVNDDKKASMLLEHNLKIGDYIIPEKGIIKVYERLNESAEINKMLVQNDVQVREITLMRDSLEDYFIKLTGGNTNA